jgi:hypothetical protein
MPAGRTWLPSPLRKVYGRFAIRESSGGPDSSEPAGAVVTAAAH